MFFGADDDDQDFVSSSGGSKLASLFGMDRASQQGGNEALTYTAPKEPKKKLDTAPVGQPTPAPAVLVAVAVFAYKYVDDKYVSQGKLGAALIGSHTTADYKILLYVTKEKPVSFAKISASFSFMVQPNNYATFYDDARQNWSVMFESEANLIQFTKQVAVARANSAMNGTSRLDSLVVQDLVLGEGGPLETGDSVEMKYTGWLMADFTIGKMFDSNASSEKLLRFRLGRSKTIRGFDEGIVGMKKNGKRLLIVPPSMAYGSDGKPGKVPADAITVFEVEVVRVKLARENVGDGVQVSGAAAVESNEGTDEDASKPRTRSLTEQPPPPAKSDKARLISRMAKMGQSMLPPMNQPIVDPGDVEVSSVVSSPSPVPHRPEVPIKSSHHHHPASPSPPVTDPTVIMSASQLYHPTQPAFQASSLGSSQLAVFQPSPYAPGMVGFHPYQMPPNVPFSTSLYPGQNPMFPPPAVQPAPAPPTSDPNMPMMLMETRQQNTEVRVSLSKISDKVDRLTEKLDQINNRQSTALSLSGSIPTMEVSMLVHTVEKIVTENERLKRELLDNSSRIEQQNSKISELLQRNQMYVEQSNVILEQRNDSFKSTAAHSQARVLSLEQEKVDLATRMSEMSTQLANSQLELTSTKKRESELRLQLERLVTTDTQSREELGSLRLQLAESTHQLEQTSVLLRDEQQQRKLLQTQVNSLQETVSELTASRDAAEKNLAEKKIKSQEAVAKLEAEIEELRTLHEHELSSLKERLKHEKNSTEMTTAQQLSQVEDDLNRQWKEKCDRLLASAQDRHQRELEELKSDKQGLEEKVQILEAKVQEMKTVRDSSELQIDTLKDELDQMRTWKDKYDSLRAQAVTMKQRYEERMAELDEERTTAEQERERVEMDLSRALDAGRRLQTQLSAAAAGSSRAAGTGGQDVQAEVKKVMNSVYRNLRAEFSPDAEYSGSEINAVMLNVIKTVTLQMMQDLKESPAQERHEVVLVKDQTEQGASASAEMETSTVEQTSASVVKSPEVQTADSMQTECINKSNDSPVEKETTSVAEETLTIPSVVAAEQVEKTEPELPKEVLSDTEVSTTDLSVEVEQSTAVGENTDVPAAETCSSEENKSSGDQDLPAESVEVVIVKETPPSSPDMKPADIDSTAEPKNHDLQSTDVSDGRDGDEQRYLQLTNSNNGQAGNDGTLDSSSDHTVDEIFLSPAGSEPDTNEGQSPVDTPAVSGENERHPSWVADAPMLDTEPPSMDSDYEEASMTTASECRGSPVPKDLNQDAVEPFGDNMPEIKEAETAAADNKKDDPLDTPTKTSQPSDDATKKPAATSKPKMTTSIFDDDDDDDDDLFSLTKLPTSRFASPFSSGSPAAAGGSAKKPATKLPVDIDEDVHRKPPPLFGNSDSEDEDNWLS